MSRYRIESLRPESEMCFVGYDKHNSSFWFYVSQLLLRDDLGRAKEGAGGHVIVWKGQSKPREIETTEELATLVADYGILTESVIEYLKADKARHSSKETALASQ